MKLLHHSQGYSQYTFIHKYRGPKRHSALDQWLPTLKLKSPTAGRGEGPWRWGLVGGVVLWMFVWQRGKHRPNLIHTQSLSVSSFCLTTGPSGRGAVSTPTSRGGCDTVRPHRTFTQEPFSVQEPNLSLLTRAGFEQVSEQILHIVLWLTLSSAVVAWMTFCDIKVEGIDGQGKLTIKKLTIKYKLKYSLAMFRNLAFWGNIL